MTLPQAADEPLGTGRHDVHGEDLPSVQVLRRIEADIRTGRLLPGSRLAPERELGARLGVARNTLRRALSALADEGPDPGSRVGAAGSSSGRASPSGSKARRASPSGRPGTATS